MKRTPLHQKHVDAQARMIDFGGWDMPVMYTDIKSEHKVIRNGVGLFDLCHMGRVRIHGPMAHDLVQKAQTNNLNTIKVGQIRYAMLLQDDGGVIDDILVHHRENDIFLVINASNRERDVARLHELAAGMDVTIDDVSDEMSMIAVQGPLSEKVVAKVAPEMAVSDLGYYQLAEGTIMGQPAMLTRTGYTGEDGFEIYAPTSIIADLWDLTLAEGKEEDIQCCGLGARDTLRLEAGMPLYGHEITEDINPVEAGLMFGVRLKKPDYPGKDVIARVKAEGPKRRIVGLTVEGRRIPREGYSIMNGDTVVGHVASGSWSPTFECAIATALVASEVLDDAPKLEVDIRGKRASAQLVDLPFYKRDGSGSLNS
ncbi:MAG: aminomethyltransferase [Planctomycetota bacterium]|jgi:aminomethyltransferase